MPKLVSTTVAAVAAVATMGGVAHAQEAGTDIPPARADLSVDFRTPPRLGTSIVGTVSSRSPASYVATPTILIGGAIGTSDLEPVLRLKAVRGHATSAPARLAIRTTLAERRRIRAVERRLHRRAVLAVRLTGTFDDGAAATPHLREFVLGGGQRP